MIIEIFENVARLPDIDDNSAIAVRAIQAGTTVKCHDKEILISNSIPLAHRFAVKTILEGEFLYSWGQPFGKALTTIHPGDYLCNAMVLEEFAKRSMASQFPSSPNFENYIRPVDLNKDLKLGKQVLFSEEQKFFAGFDRGIRGVGTRNYIIVLGTSARTAGFVNNLTTSFNKNSATRPFTFYPNVDGVVPIAHTEGATEESPNNKTLILRTLSGFFIHSNVGAVLSVDFGDEVINNQALKDYLIKFHYPLDEVLHQFFRIDTSYEDALTRAKELIEQWLPRVNRFKRSPQPLSKVKMALQCGGSDAFSGVSGNPLASWIGREIIRYGGVANLAETDELIGSEGYVLKNVRSLEVARKFLSVSERFKNWTNRHGHSAEGNPSGGNVYRGLYNIAIKSIGAARKRHPDVRLDHVIEYAEPMKEPGFYFMDSPGNDPESIAGQVASGANLIYFITGNGAITNFPFVPTLKIMTTTERFDLLHGDIDINAGRYLEGESLDSLGKEALELTLRVLSGEKSAGEKAGHSQVNLWRNWYLDETLDLSSLQTEDLLPGIPLPLRYQKCNTPIQYEAIRSNKGHQADRVGVILPTSLCASEIAKILADRLNQQAIDQNQQISRFVALPHTEGCGSSGGNNIDALVRTNLSHLLHPNVALAVSLEHGCEKTHNAYMRRELEKRGGDAEQVGWFSIQLDGGIENVLEKAISWCQSHPALCEGRIETVDAKGLRVGLLTRGPLPDFLQSTLTIFCQKLLDGGLSVIVPENSSVLLNRVSQEILADLPQPTLAYGQQAQVSGFHVMASAAATLEETLTGIGGSGAQVVFTFLKNLPISSHPMLAVVQVTWSGNRHNPFQEDFDMILPQDPQQGSEQLLGMLKAVLSRKYMPKNNARLNHIYQVSRGMRGISL